MSDGRNTSSTRENVRIPHITINAFCDTPEAAEAVGLAGKDRLMSRTQVTVRPGGMAGAIDHYQKETTPNLVIIESTLGADRFLAELDRLAEVCEPGTKLMVIGHANDIVLYRELMRRKVSEYLLFPIDPVSLIESISGVYGESGKEKLGQVHAFIGAKGGCGSSTIAHNVSWTAARAIGSEVVLADLDLPFGTVGLDFNQETVQGIAEALQESARLDGVLLDRLLTRCGDGLSILAAPTSLERPYDLPEGAFETLIEVAQTVVPVMVLDMPHVWTGWSRRTLVSANEIVITAEPDLANLRNAKSLLSVLRQARPNDPPPRLVLNKVGMPKREEIKPAEFAKAMGIDPIACIPFDAALFVTAANKGEMVGQSSPRAAAAKAFKDISEAITGRKQAKGGRAALPFADLLGRLTGKAGGRSLNGS